MRAWQHADRFDPAKVSNRSWLYKIATNVCSDMLRGSRRRARSMNLSAVSYTHLTLPTKRIV